MPDSPPLPTAKCTPELHEKYGGACFWCCDSCNQDRHICHFCGEELRHDGTEWGDDREVHPCTVECVCGHIGHEHFADSCRGAEITYLGAVVEADCDCTTYRPREKS